MQFSNGSPFTKSIFIKTSLSKIIEYTKNDETANDKKTEKYDKTNRNEHHDKKRTLR